jgi:hypothetical protein
VTWEDYELWGVFAQHYDVNGDTLWTSPIRVGGGEGDPYQEAVADGSGGLLVSYYNQDEGYSFVQRINADGNLAWEEDGVAVIDDHHCWIVPDGQGGAVVMSENGYVNKVSADGTLPWAEADNPRVFSDDSDATKIAPDGTGGAILLWVEGDSFSGLALQRVDADGEFAWNGGEPLRLSEEYPEYPSLIPIEGGAIVVWQDNTVSHGYAVMAQKINASGQIQWGEGGAVVALEHIGWPEAASDGAGGAFVTWGDWSTDTVLAQHMGANGEPVWTEKVHMSPEGDLNVVFDWHPRRTVEDGLGGFITAWPTNDKKIKAQRCDASGDVLWTTAGAVLAQGQSIFYWPRLASNGQGGAVAVWVDGLDDTSKDIFMQGVSAEGVAGNPGYTPPADPDDPSDDPSDDPPATGGSSGSNGLCFAVAAVPAGGAGALLVLLAGAGGLFMPRRR